MSTTQTLDGRPILPAMEQMPCQNLEVDYSAAYLKLQTDGPLIGYGMTFTIGRGNDIVCHAIQEVVKRVVGKDLESLFADMGNTWNLLTSDPQLRWCVPEKGVIHLATAAVDNAIWDLYAKSRKKPLWKLIVDMSPEELVRSTTFKYISDVLTPQEALEMLQAKASGKSAREQTVREVGYPAYVTSAGWLRYNDQKVARLIREAIKAGFTHFKMKVGSSLDDDIRRAKLIRAIIDDPASFPPGYVHPDPASLVGKNAGPTGCVLMMDANQVWDVPEAIEYVSHLAEAKPWFIEEPTAPDDFLGHAAIRAGLKPYGIGVATGEHAHNRVAFKQLLQANAVDVAQPDACRLAGVSEVLAVLLLAAKFGVLACFHAGGVGLCEHTIHLR
ncbi:enolase C-terminal domain-like protein [Ceratobasidium sp. AG-Ba]|nr:enolase C-terminal domain-like protein [Ceratobasidium sp. AG-Ba]